MGMLLAHCTVAVEDPKHMLTELLEHYEEHGRVTTGERTGSVVTDFGTAWLEALERAIAIRTEAPDETSLAYMKYGIAFHLYEFAADGPVPDIRWEGHGEVDVPPPYFREMRVVSAHDLTPKMRRVVLRGTDLERFSRDGIHARLLFPPKGRTPVWPVAGADGRPRFPDGEDALTARSYTVRALDVARGEATIDMLRHDDDATPGSRFAVTAEPGDLVGMIGPAGEGVPKARTLLLLGDETAIPAIARILEALPEENSAHVHIEIADEGERQALPEREGIAVEWILRGERRLADVVTALEPATIDPELFVWAGCEFADFKAIRRHCRAVLGLKREQHHVAPYWRRGRVGDDSMVEKGE